uniref:Pdk1 n=1 Tax=Arundo donax TaxID=35708 RepID=A0A0A9CT14_ARUDO
MCSVRHSPIPSAPLFRAANASSGVSALAITFSCLNSSTQDMKVPKLPLRAGGESGCLPRITSPVDPFSDSHSPSCSTLSPMTTAFSVSLTWMLEHPETQHFPQPRATTAA